jgi:hypothetical protein
MNVGLSLGSRQWYFIAHRLVSTGRIVKLIVTEGVLCLHRLSLYSLIMVTVLSDYLPLCQAWISFSDQTYHFSFYTSQLQILLWPQTKNIDLILSKGDGNTIKSDYMLSKQILLLFVDVATH